MKRLTGVAVAAVALCGAITLLKLLYDSNYRRPNVVLVSIDTLNLNYTSIFAPEVHETPNLAAFARQGVSFRHAYTTVPITLPAHTTLMSGTSTLRHGVMANGDTVPLSVNTLAEIFRDRGYHTAAFISLAVLKQSVRLDQGFDEFDDPFSETHPRFYRPADELLAAVRSWLLGRSRDPFFLWVHFSDPHEPYLPVDAPPDTLLELDGRAVAHCSLSARVRVDATVTLSPGRHRLRWVSVREPRADDFAETRIQLTLLNPEDLAPYATPALDESQLTVDLRPEWSVDLVNPTDQDLILELRFSGRVVRPPPSEVIPNYRAEVAYTDRHLGELEELIASTGPGRETLWIIVSDHGEGLFHHRTLGHATHVFEDQLRILWLVRGPGIPSGRVEEAPALLEDVAPTLLDLLGWKEGDDMVGRSFAGCWSDGPCRGRERWWSFALEHEDRRLTGLAGYRWPHKWMWRRGEARRSHHLLEDPAEEHNLLDAGSNDHRAEVDAIADDFRRVRDAIALRLSHPQRGSWGEKEVDLLRSLGYIGDSPSGSAPLRDEE